MTLPGTRPWSDELQPLESLDGGTEARDGGRLGARALTSSPSMVTTKSKLPKRTCASGTQLMPWLAIRSLVMSIETRKGPYLRQLSVFRTSTNE